MGILDPGFNSNSFSTGLSEKLNLVLAGKMCHLAAHCGNGMLRNNFREKKVAHSLTKCRDHFTAACKGQMKQQASNESYIGTSSLHGKV